jgi:hypothetical protein
MRRSLCLTVLLVVVSAPSALRAGDPGDAGALFLRVGMGARASAMGEAFIGAAEDASAVYWNPAAMGAVLGTRLMFTHNEYIHTMRLEQIALTHETEYGTIGLGFTGLYMDEMDRYEDTPSATPLGKFSAYDVCFSVAFARYLVPNLAAGVAVKAVHEKIDQETATGTAFDVGLYHVSKIPGVKFAVVATNVGAPMKFVSQEFALPRTVKIGGSYQREVPRIKGAILATADVVFPNDGDARPHLGAEYGFDKRLFVRAGYKGGYDTQGAAFGLGVRLRQFEVDYGVLFGGNDLGDSHRLSLSLRV